MWHFADRRTSLLLGWPMILLLPGIGPIRWLGGIRLKIATAGAAVSYHFAAIPTFQINTTSEGRSFCRIAPDPLPLLPNLKHRMLVVEINQKAGLHIGAAFGTRSFLIIHSHTSILRAACFAAYCYYT